MAVLAIDRPADVDVQLLEVDVECLGDVAHDGADELALGVALFACLYVLLGDTALGEIDVALVAVDAEDHDGLLAADLDERGHGADAAAAAAAGGLGSDGALDEISVCKGITKASVGAEQGREERMCSKHHVYSVEIKRGRPCGSGIRVKITCCVEPKFESESVT